MLRRELTDKKGQDMHDCEKIDGKELWSCFETDDPMLLSVRQDFKDEKSFKSFITHVNFCPFCGFQPDRSKREDFYRPDDIKTYQDAIDTVHSELCTAFDYDENCNSLCVDLRYLLERYKMRYSEHWR